MKCVCIGGAVDREGGDSRSRRGSSRSRRGGPGQGWGGCKWIELWRNCGKTRRAPEMKCGRAWRYRLEQATKGRVEVCRIRHYSSKQIEQRRLMSALPLGMNHRQV
eukprot:2526704-Pleurochrysis_carterae.AAC.1